MGDESHVWRQWTIAVYRPKSGTEVKMQVFPIEWRYSSFGCGMEVEIDSTFGETQPDVMIRLVKLLHRQCVERPHTNLQRFTEMPHLI